MAASTEEGMASGSSADIFSSNHTLPQIRAIHRSLYVSVDEKSARLRTQVGASYRDLLGTADSIVQMHDDIYTIQSVLGGMGGRCGRAVIGKKVLNVAQLATSDKADADKQHTRTIARAKLLERCNLVAGRILKSRAYNDTQGSIGDRLLVASKVFVLSRLLVTSFTDDKVLSPDITAIVKNADHNMGSLRRQLLRRISKVLEHRIDESDQPNVVKALCAYSLATSSGTRDVLRYFLRTRGDAISSVLDCDSHGSERNGNNISTALRLYVGTLLDVQNLLSRKLANALAGLKTSPLVTDQALLSLEGLRLDVSCRWCGDEIQYYAPFIRHDDLDGSQARAMLTNWASKGGEAIIDGLNTTMEFMTDFHLIVNLRTTVLQLWIRDGGKAKGFDPSGMLDSLRTAFRDRMLHVLELKASKLHLVASEVSASLRAGHDCVTDQHANLWADSPAAPGVAGPDRILHELVAKLHGRNDAVSKAVNCFYSWKHVIDGVCRQLERLGNQRWDNDIDEIEDEETISTRQQLLSGDDTRALQVRLQSALERGFKDLDGEFARLWETHARMSNMDGGKMAMYIIRVLRDIRASMPQLETATASKLGLSIIPSLHAKLSETVIAAPVKQFTTMLPMQKTVIGRGLWESDPALPTQPSPHTLRFLRNVSHAMAMAGSDLWSEAAVNSVKRQLSNDICGAWLEAVDLLLADDSTLGLFEESDASQPKGTMEERIQDESEDKEAISTAPSCSVTPSKEHQRQDLLAQWLFDINFLRLSLDPVLEEGSRFAELESCVLRVVGLNHSNSKPRILKSAQTYWKKTSLLFGILSASPSL